MTTRSFVTTFRDELGCGLGAADLSHGAAPSPLLDPLLPARSGVVCATPTTDRILVVEDEHLVALNILQVLARMGHVAVVAYSGEEAVHRAMTGLFDLVLMDIKLNGDVDGIEAARSIRAVRDVPIIFLTAYADDGTLERARVTEPYGYVVKPFRERELTAAITMALHHHTADRLRSERQQLEQFLADATARMAASLDYHTVARGAAKLLVPRYADWTLVHLADTGDELESFTHAYPDPDLGDHNRASCPCHDTRLFDALEHSKLVIEIEHVGQTLLDSLCDHHRAVLRALDLRSLLSVPLVARDRRLGGLVLVAGRSRAPYGAADLSFAEDFAQRLGMALDNALLYRKAEQAIRMRDDVLAIVSHDLRSPLGAIMLRAGSLLAHPEVRETGDWIVHSAKRMNSLIGDLLDASAVNANGGMLAIDPRACSAAQLVDEAVEMFRMHADAASIDLTADMRDDTIRVICDRERILQVLSNLIGNALKFTAEHGTVRVSAELQATTVRFEVRDTGCGILPDQIPHLFERFWRAQNRRGGAGLGLFIANGIIASHGSKLCVESTSGVGTVFAFSLPSPP